MMIKTETEESLMLFKISLLDLFDAIFDILENSNVSSIVDSSVLAAI
jgi:hypothetical protein